MSRLSGSLKGALRILLILLLAMGVGAVVILLIGENEIVLGEIFAGYTTSDKDHCYDIAISDTDDMRAFLTEAIQKSDFVSGVEPKTTDRLVTLSTCAYAFENARYIAIGRLIPVWNREIQANGAR